MLSAFKFTRGPTIDPGADVFPQRRASKPRKTLHACGLFFKVYFFRVYSFRVYSFQGSLVRKCSLNYLLGLKFTSGPTIDPGADVFPQRRMILGGKITAKTNAFCNLEVGAQQLPLPTGGETSDRKKKASFTSRKNKNLELSPKSARANGCRFYVLKRKERKRRSAFGAEGAEGAVWARSAPEDT